MPAAQVGPPTDYEFSFVVEFMAQGFNPDFARFLHSYSEVPRATRKVILDGRPRALAFLTTSAMRNRALRLHWKDRTAEFGRQWRLGDDGKWARIETPPALLGPDDNGKPPATPQNPELAALLGQPVKNMIDALRTGAYDPLLKQAIEAERAGQARAGAIAALAARYGSMQTA